MRTPFLAGVVLANAVTAFAAQTGSRPAPAQTPPLTPGKPVTLNGCVRKSEVDPNQFTLSDPRDGTTYRLTGADVRPHIGRKVRIVGGLVPSANLAAQAGAIDASHAAVAGVVEQEQGGGHGGMPPEFRITRVRPLVGTCTP